MDVDFEVEVFDEDDFVVVTLEDVVVEVLEDVVWILEDDVVVVVHGLEDDVVCD